VPLVFETSGAFHPNVNQFLYNIGRACNHAAPTDATPSAPTFTRYWLAALSCTLRRETARALVRITRAAFINAGLNPDRDTVDSSPAGLPHQHPEDDHNAQYAAEHDQVDHAPELDPYAPDQDADFVPLQ